LVKFSGNFFQSPPFFFFSSYPIFSSFHLRIRECREIERERDETDNMRETDETEREAVHGKAVYGSSVTSLAGEKKVRAMRVLKAAVWVVVVAVAMGLMVGTFLMVAVEKAVVLVAVGGVLVLVLVVLMSRRSLSPSLSLSSFTSFPAT
jgi:hypothetical protein